MKVKDILRFSADLRGKDCSKEAALLCERLDLDVSRKADELSFGNRKKVAIVCALQSNPKLLILDEPTGGLDPLMQHEFFDIIRERNKNGTTVFISSHILSEVQNNCTRAAVIREGRIIACDNVDALGRTNAKRVSVCGEIDLSGLDGIKDLSTGELTPEMVGTSFGMALGGRAAHPRQMDRQGLALHRDRHLLHRQRRAAAHRRRFVQRQKEKIKPYLIKRLKKANAFWSYNIDAIKDVPDDILVELVFLHLDIDDIDKLFEIYSSKYIKKAWIENVIPLGDRYFVLNKFFAWYYFHMKKPGAYVRAMETRQINKRLFA